MSKIIFLSLYISLLILPENSYSQAIMYKVANGGNEDINAHGTCRNVANATGKDLMVGVKTSTEWSSFRAATVTNVTKSDCDLCPGVSTIGALCPNGAKYAGTINYGGSIGTRKILIVPGGCTDSATPTCADTVDTVSKTWEAAPGQTTTGATSTSDGYANTTAILAAGGQAKAAASYCANMTFGGLSEWYLPALDELTHLYTNVAALDSSTFMWAYWSSTETAFDAARVKVMDGSNPTQGKTNSNGVRCMLRY